MRFAYLLVFLQTLSRAYGPKALESNLQIGTAVLHQLRPIHRLPEQMRCCYRRHRLASRHQHWQKHWTLYFSVALVCCGPYSSHNSQNYSWDSPWRHVWWPHAWGESDIWSRTASRQYWQSGMGAKQMWHESQDLHVQVVCNFVTLLLVFLFILSLITHNGLRDILHWNIAFSLFYFLLSDNDVNVIYRSYWTTFCRLYLPLFALY